MDSKLQTEPRQKAVKRSPKRYITDYEEDPVVIGLERTYPKILLAFIGFTCGLGDVVTTWYALTYKRAIEDNPVTAKSIESYGLYLTLGMLLLVTSLLAAWTFLYSNYRTIDYIFKSITIIWVIQKIWVLTSNIIVLSGGTSISMIHYLKMLS